MNVADPNQLSIDLGTEACRLLSDGSRLRLLLLLETHALSANELTEITGLAQSRVSTHLTKLKRAGLVRDERRGQASLYTVAGDAPAAAGAIWNLLRPRLDDPQARLDLERAGEVIANRDQGRTWAESVAGRMELHYSPGRNWEVTSRALMNLVQLGDVLDLASGDGVFAQLISPHARTVTCVDVSEVVIKAARKRLVTCANVTLHCHDMHELPFADGSFDIVFAMQSLNFSDTPLRALKEATRLLRADGKLVVATLRRHGHEETRKAFDHANLGFEVDQLRSLLVESGLRVHECAVSSRETKPPYFEIVSALATRR